MGLLRRSFMARLLVYFLLLSIVPLTAVGYVAYSFGRQVIVDDVTSHLESVATLKEQSVENLFRHTAQNLEVAAANTHVIDAASVMATAATGSPQYVDAHRTLVHEFRTVADMERASPILFLCPTSGRVLAASHDGWEGRFRESETFFLEGKKDSYASDVFYSITMGRPTFVFSAPLKDSEGRLLGVLAAHLNMERLNQIMMLWSGLGETGETFLVGRSNLLITDIAFEPGSAYEKWIFGVGAVRALGGERDVDLFLDYRDEPVIGAYRPIMEGKMVLIAKQDQAEAFAPVRDLRNAIALVGGVLVALAAGMGVLLARQTTDPLARLATYARRITGGEYEAQLDVRGKDEIASVSADVQTMVEQLQYEIRERQEMQERLVRQERLAVLGQLAGGVGHELRNPLGVIRNVAYYLRMIIKEPGPKVEKSLDQLEQEVARSDRIITSLLDFARQKPPGLRAVNVSDIVGQALSQIDVPDRVEVVTHLDDAVPLVPADPDQLAQVFSNIALNGFQAMPEGGRVTVRVEALDPGWVHASIADTGVGLSPENMEKVFQPLFTTKATGIGLGLALSKTIVEAHGGTIGVESEPGKGSTFTVRLPVDGEKAGL